MDYTFLETLSTPSVKAAQAANGAAEFWGDFKGHRQFEHFTENEIEFLAERDSFYMATVAENGWPYVQHRGGPKGFVRALNDKTLAFADFRGNRQYISVGNLGASDRVALILVDYPHRARLKILGHARIEDLSQNPELAKKLEMPGYKAKVERAIVVELVAFDWNCPQHITPRFTEAELTKVLEPVRDRIAKLEAENQALQAKLEAQTQLLREKPSS